MPEGSYLKRSKNPSHEYPLAMKEVATYYGEAQVLKDVSLSVHINEVAAILGSNGAGKTTLLRTLAGLVKPRSGEIIFKGETITGKAPNEILRMGIAIVPEGRELFGSMSVSDNLLLGTYSLSKAKRTKILKSQLEMIFNLFPVLKQRLRQKSETLSGGEQQMLALARALMSSPEFLALDEPSLGLAPLLVMEMMKRLKLICRDWGVSILLVEQNAKAAMKISGYVYILERGEMTLEGKTEEVMANPKIQSAYIGA